LTELTTTISKQLLVAVGTAIGHSY